MAAKRTALPFPLVDGLTRRQQEQLRQNFHATVASIGVVEVVMKEVTFDTPDLDTGVKFFTPQAGDVILDGFVVITEAWDQPAFLDVDDGLHVASGFFNAGVLNDLQNYEWGITQGYGSSVWLTRQNANPSTLGEVGVRFDYGIVPMFVNTPLTMTLWVTDNGLISGGPTGATTGRAILYMMIAHPRNLN